MVSNVSYFVYCLLLYDDTNVMPMYTTQGMF